MMTEPCTSVARCHKFWLAWESKFEIYFPHWFPTSQVMQQQQQQQQQQQEEEEEEEKEEEEEEEEQQQKAYTHVTKKTVNNATSERCELVKPQVKLWCIKSEMS